jgi:hypothetical protein
LRLSLYPVCPALLADAEFALIRFGLDLTSSCTLDLGDLLGLRPLLHAAGGALPQARRAALFNPALSTDPAALRRYQKPAPPFALRSVSALAGEYHEGDRLELEVLFLGTGTLAIGDFLIVLQALGEGGLTHGEGRFEVALAQSLGADGKWRGLWRNTRSNTELAPELLRLDQWLDRNWPEEWPVVFELTTPARLVAAGRVLRQPQFRQLFPFLLRRVSSMLHAHCGLEPLDDPVRLLETAARVEARWLESRWVDWHGRAGRDEPDTIGGCAGRLWLGGPELEEVLWVILLATLCGVGKGAAYGAGGCRLSWG